MQDVIIKLLKQNSDEKYKAFNVKLIPNVDSEKSLGVSLVNLRKIAKSIKGQEIVNEFLNDLPHFYLEENTLHGVLIEQIKDVDECLERIDAFLPFVDNWQTCDVFNPKILKKDSQKLLAFIEKWIKSDLEYTVRFAIGMLMRRFADDLFEVKYLEMVSEVKSDKYYVNMMCSWYFATLLAKQYDQTIKIIESNKLSDFVHNKSIQKAVESYRISDEQKIYLKSLKRKMLKTKEQL